MSGPEYKKPIVFGGVILIIVVLSTLFFVWHDNHVAEKGKYSIENANINRLVNLRCIV